MSYHVALLRGINVGGKNRLPMKELVSVIEAQGGTDIQTYIQSGNAIFQHKDCDIETIAQNIGNAISKNKGFHPNVNVMKGDEFKLIAKQNPYAKAEAEPKSLHLFFLDSVPDNPDFEALNKLKTKTESYKLIGNVLYFHAPDGFGRSKLAAKAEKLLGVPATARNWNTVAHLLEMLNSE